MIEALLSAVCAIGAVVIFVFLFLLFGALIALVIGGSDFSDGVQKPPLSPKQKPESKLVKRTWGNP